MDSKKRILIVDDDDNIAKMYITHMEIKGFETMRVTNGEDALSATLKFKPDLVILDVMMPKISGFDVADILHQTEATKDIPIIIVSALGGKEDREKAMAAGAAEYYVKSEVDLDSISQRIEAILKSN